MWSGALKARACPVKGAGWCGRIVANVNICEPSVPYGPILLLSCWEKIVWLVPRPNRWVTQLTDIVSQTIALMVRDSARHRCGENLGQRMGGRWHPDFYWEEIWGEFYRNEVFTLKHSIQCPSSHPSTLLIPVLRIIWWQEAEAHSNDLTWNGGLIVGSTPGPPRHWKIGRQLPLHISHIHFRFSFFHCLSPYPPLACHGCSISDSTLHSNTSVTTSIS